MGETDKPESPVAPGKEPPGHEILGIRVNPVSITALTGLALEEHRPSAVRVIGHLNLHGLHLARKHPAMKILYQKCAVVHADGMPIVWMGRALGYPFRPTHRVTYVDWLPELLEAADERGCAVFFLGGKPEVGPRVAKTVAAEYPNIRFGYHHGFLHSQDDHQRVLDEIRQFNPRLLFVGMGMPRQEAWILEHLELLPRCTVLPCGACFDYYAGLAGTPPRILGRMGLEWAYRLVMEPRRLWRRYLLEPLVLAPDLVRALVNQRVRKGRVERG